MTTALELVEVSVRYEEQLIIDRASLRVSAGEIVSIVGPSGIGKSTLLAAIAGLVPIESGRISIEGKDVTKLAPYRRRCGMVFQDPLLFTQMNVLENVAYGPRRIGASPTHARDYARELLAWAGVAQLAERSVMTLSGGQAQRVALVRAIAAQPRILLLDEPFSGLDASVRATLAGQVRQLIISSKLAALHVTHDLAEAHGMGDRVVGLSELCAVR